MVLVRAEPFEVSTEHHEEEERDFLTAHRWFTLEELREHQEVLVPANFPELLEPLLAGIYPLHPITVGV